MNTQSVGTVSEERGGKRTREGGKSGVGRLERMNHGSGIKDQDDKSIIKVRGGGRRSACSLCVRSCRG